MTPLLSPCPVNWHKIPYKYYLKWKQACFKATCCKTRQTHGQLVTCVFVQKSAKPILNWRTRPALYALNWGPMVNYPLWRLLLGSKIYILDGKIEKNKEEMWKYLRKSEWCYFKCVYNLNRELFFYFILFYFIIQNVKGGRLWWCFQELYRT